jgi:hypothetical protein
MHRWSAKVSLLEHPAQNSPFQQTREMFMQSLYKIHPFYPQIPTNKTRECRIGARRRQRDDRKMRLHERV